MQFAVVTQVIGWIGTILILVAYYLVSQKKVDGQTGSYQIMNLLGALAVGINVGFQRAWPALGLQIVWGIIAVLALIKTATKK